MKLSRNSHRRYERFFQEYFNDNSLVLPEIRIYCRRGARILTKILAVDGITFGRHIFIAQNHLKRDAKGRLFITKELLAHELTHTMQYVREGFFGFLFHYVAEYFYGLRRKKRWDFASRMDAYFEIRHEVEARKCASAFMNFLKENKNG